MAAPEHRPGLSVALHSLRLENVLYLLPISLLLGTNFPLFAVSGRTVHVGTTEIILIVLSAGILLRIFRRQLSLVTIRAIPPTIVLFSLAIPVTLLLSLPSHAVFSVDPYVEVMRWFEYLSILVITLLLVRTEIQVKHLLLILLLGASANVAAALYQAATFNFYESRLYGLFISSTNRAGISVSNPNAIAALFMVVTLFLIPFALDKSSPQRTIQYYALILATTIALVLTASRSAMLGLLFGAAVILMFNMRRAMHFVALFLLGLIALVLGIASFSPYFLNRLAGTFVLGPDSVDSQAILHRLANWKEVGSRLAENSLTGVGYGRFKDYFGFLTPDNFFLEIAATMGIVGLLLLLLMLGQVLYRAYRMPARPDSFPFSLKVGYLASAVGFLVANLFAGLFFHPRLLGSFWLVTGLLFCASLLNSPISEGKRENT